MTDFQPSAEACAMMAASAKAHAKLSKLGEELRLVFVEGGLEISIGSMAASEHIFIREPELAVEDTASTDARALEIVEDLLALVRPEARHGVGLQAAGPSTSTPQPEADADFFGAAGPAAEPIGWHGFTDQQSGKAATTRHSKPPTALERRVDLAIEVAKARKGKAGTLHRLAWMADKQASWPTATRRDDLVSVYKNGSVRTQIKRFEKGAE